MMKSIRAIAFVVASALALLAPAVGHAQGSALDRISKDKTLRVGWAVWNPYVYRDPQTNKVVGISYDLVEDLGKALGVKVEWVEDSWATLPAGVQAHKFDITNLMAITPPRAEAIDFTEAVTQHGLSLIAPKAKVAQTKGWQDWDRPDLKIAVTLGANSDMFVTEKFKKAQIVRLKTVPENVLALMSGRVDAHASTIDALKSIQKEHPDLAIVPGSFGGSEVAFGVPKGDKALAQAVNKFVEDAKRSGRIKQLLDKYGLDASFAAQ
jgi:ABC-type amino acid transport substrate-binding protein